jgi:hypothetical protein
MCGLGSTSGVRVGSVCGWLFRLAPGHHFGRHGELRQRLEILGKQHKW